VVWLLKVSGMLIIIITCSIAGLIKASTTQKRAEKLEKFALCTSALAERIHITEGELDFLLRQSFPEELIQVTEDKITLELSFLQDNDISVLEEFISGLGLGDPEGEYKRITAYSKIIKEHSNEAKASALSLCRMYKSCGFLVGLFLCIFFL